MEPVRGADAGAEAKAAAEVAAEVADTPDGFGPGKLPEDSSGLL